MSRRATAALVAALTLLPATAAHGQDRARFDTRVLSLIGPPGYPANAYPFPDGRHVYEGTYLNESSRVPSRVLELDADAGTILRSWSIDGQTLDGTQGVQVASSTADGDLVLLDHSPPRVLLLDRATGDQTTYATFPSAAVPNHAVWGPDGSLYITDYEHPTLWRVPPGGGGTAEPWLTDPRLAGGPFGTTGIGLRADHRTLLVAMQSQLNDTGTNPATGRIFELPIGVDGRPGPLRQLWESRPFDGPDAFGIARSGRVYIALLLANQIGVIEPDGREAERFGPDNGSSVPFDTPSSARFLGTRLVVANQSFLAADPTHQAVLDVETGEPGLPELIPAGAGRKDAVAPRLSGVRFTGTRLRFAVDEPARVSLRVERRVATRWRTVRRTATDVAAGRHVRTLRGLAKATRPVTAGRWRVTLRATDPSGNASGTARATARVRG